MSLFKQMFLAMCLFLVVAIAGGIVISVEAQREQLLAQLRSHAQDAATALGLSMTAHVDDTAMMELMVSSIFDGGYFERIAVVRLDTDKVVVERFADNQVAESPGWFNQLVDINAQAGDALIMRGWQQVARVEVLSNPQFALARLWDSALANLLWLLACGAASAALGYLLLKRYLRPLRAVELQAQAISQRDFYVQRSLPDAPELKRVTLAMNQMVERLKGLFAADAARSEQLQRDAYQDSHTGLANRRHLTDRLNLQLRPSEHHADGYLIVLRLNDLAGLNIRQGAPHTDALIHAVAQLLSQHCQGVGRSEWLAARSRGGEFALIAPGLELDDAELLATELSQQLDTLYQTGASDVTPVAFLGLAAFCPGEDAVSIFARADQAIAQAQHQRNRNWARVDTCAVLTPRSLHEWREWIDYALTEGRLELYLQPVIDSHSSALLHRKVLARLIDPRGEAVPAGRFLPWIERLGWSARFDLAMLEQSLLLLKKQPQPLALSVACSTLLDPSSATLLQGLLKRHTDQARLLTLEVDERHLPPPAELEGISHAIRATGARLGVQHFGGRFSLIGNLAHLCLAYLKLDGSYTHAIDQDPDKRLFIETILRATRSIDLPLIAEMVETEGQLDVLRELGVQGAMGQLIGPPAPCQ